MEVKKIALRPVSIALFIVVSFCPSVHGKIQAPKLNDLIKNSDLIAEGKVVKISEVRGVRIARVELTRIHKGSSTIKSVYLWASSTWVCDISGADLNESGLYFLSSVTARQSNAEAAEFGRELDRVLQGEALYRICSFGYGRFINKGNGRLEASDYVRFPQTVAVKYLRTGDYTSVAMVEAQDIVWLIHTSH